MPIYADPVADRLNAAVAAKGLGAWMHEPRGAHGEWAAGLADKLDRDVPGEPRPFNTGIFAKREAAKYHAREASKALRAGDLARAGGNLARARDNAEEFAKGIRDTDALPSERAAARHAARALRDALSEFGKRHAGTPDYYATEEMERDIYGHAMTPETRSVETSLAAARATAARHNASIARMPG